MMLLDMAFAGALATSECSIPLLNLGERVLFGRPGSRMQYPYVIGRGNWAWDKQKALYEIIPPQGGGGGPNWNRATRLEGYTGGVRP